jgi:hypothetical protein
MRSRMLRRNAGGGPASEAQQGFVAVQTGCRKPMAFRRMSK